MEKYKCNKCDKNFKRKEHLTYHITNNSCKIYKYKCKMCDKQFTTDSSMYRHMKYNCKIKREQDNEKNEIYEKLIKLEEENRILKDKIKKVEKENKMINMKYIDNKIINNGIMDNRTINVLVGYGKEDMSKIDKTDILKGIKKGFYSTLYLTDTVHFNPKYPEYHNVYIPNMKNKYAMMYDGIDWTLVMKDELIDKIYDEKKNYIEENLDDFFDSLSQSQRNALDRWINTDDEHVKIKEVKDKIKLLLYNKRNIPLKTIELKPIN